MKKFSQASVLAKLLTGFSILIAMMLVLGIVSIYQLHVSKTHIDKFRDNRMPGVRYTLEMRGVLSEMRLQQIQYIGSVTPAEREQHRGELLQNQETFLKAQREFAKISADAPEDTRTLFNTVVDNFRNFVDVNAKVIEAVSAGGLRRHLKSAARCRPNTAPS
jgi:methyl-accepting chemotaxis protein